MQTFKKEIQKFKGGTIEDRIAHFTDAVLSDTSHDNWQLISGVITWLLIENKIGCYQTEPGMES